MTSKSVRKRYNITKACRPVVIMKFTGSPSPINYLAFEFSSRAFLKVIFSSPASRRRQKSKP